MINNRNSVKQLIDFSGLEWGSIHPTDIDATLEFRNKLFIIIEAKLRGKKMGDGQKYLIQNICNSIHRPNLKYCYGFLVDHDVADTSKPIMLVNCTVREIYMPKSGNWVTQTEQKTIKPIIDWLLGECGIVLDDPMEEHREWLSDLDAYDLRTGGAVFTFPAPNPAGI